MAGSLTRHCEPPAGSRRPATSSSLAVTQSGLAPGQPGIPGRFRARCAHVASWCSLADRPACPADLRDEIERREGRHRHPDSFDGDHQLGIETFSSDRDSRRCGSVARGGDGHDRDADVWPEGQPRSRSAGEHTVRVPRRDRTGPDFRQRRELPGAEDAGGQPPQVTTPCQPLHRSSYVRMVGRAQDAAGPGEDRCYLVRGAHADNDDARRPGRGGAERQSAVICGYLTAGDCP